MAKKKKAKKGKKKKALTAEDIAKAEAKRVLEEKAKELYECMLECKHEEALMNEYQLQKERLNKFWELSKTKRSQLKDSLRGKVRQQRNLDERQRYEMKVYKEKVKHLLHEMHQHTVEEQIGGAKQLKLQQFGNRGEQREIELGTRRLKVAKKDRELEVNNNLVKLRLEYQKDIMAVREEFENHLNELIRHNRQSMERARKEATERKRKEMERISKLKGASIDRLVKQHKSAFDEIKEYYRDVTLLNLELIKTHKAQVGEQKQIEQVLHKDARQLVNAYKKLSQPLRKNRKLEVKLSADYEQYKTEKALLTEALGKIEDLEAKIKDKQWEKEVLVQKISQFVEKKGKLEKKRATAISEAQQKAGFKNLLLEKKLEALNSDIDTTDAVIREVLEKTSLPPEVIGNLKFNTGDVLAKRTKEVERLQDQRVLLRKAYYDSLQSYEALLKKYNIPLEELGFVPATI